MISKLTKTVSLGFKVINACIPSGVLQIAILEGLKILVNRNNNDLDNIVLKSYIKKSNLKAEEKESLLKNL
jgi:hypothetical protein